MTLQLFIASPNRPNCPFDESYWRVGICLMDGRSHSMIAQMVRPPLILQIIASGLRAGRR